MIWYVIWGIGDPLVPVPGVSDVTLGQYCGYFSISHTDGENAIGDESEFSEPIISPQKHETLYNCKLSYGYCISFSVKTNFSTRINEITTPPKRNSLTVHTDCSFSPD